MKPDRTTAAPAGTRAVFIPEEFFHKLARAGGSAGLDDPAGDLLAHLIEGAVDDPENLLEIAHGLADNQRAARADILASASELIAAERGSGRAAVSVPVQVSAYHLEGMTLAAWCKGNDDASGWASRVLASRRLPKPARPYSYPERPTGHAVTVTLPRERFDELDVLATRAGLSLREFIHAVLVSASRKYRATMDTQAAPPAAPAGDCVVSVAPRAQGGRITMNLDRELSDRIEEHALAIRTTLRELIALAVTGDRSAFHSVAVTYQSTPGHSFTMDLDRARLASLTTRARNACLPVPEFVRRALQDVPELWPTAYEENVLPFFTGHFRRA